MLKLYISSSLTNIPLTQTNVLIPNHSILSFFLQQQLWLLATGAVRERVGNGRQYSIEWSDGTMGMQSAPYIFGPFTKQHPLAVGDRVLAIVDSAELLYLPGIITNEKDGKLSVKFCDGSV